MPAATFTTEPVSHPTGGGGLVGNLVGGVVNGVLGLLGLRLDWITDPAVAERLKANYAEELLDIPESQNYTGNEAVLFPGTYCGGLTVDGKGVLFMPGNYIMLDGPLTFKNGAQAKAENVSFILNGQNSVVTVESGSTVHLKAPRAGAMAGLALYQDRQNAKLGKTVAYPNGVNVISSGGALNVTGTMYFPTQGLEVVGDSRLGAEAPATSFIAYQVGFSGDTKAEVKVDHVKGGIPPLLPRSDDGARLIE